MNDQLGPIEDIAAQLAKLPSIGRKTAQRLAYHIVSLPVESVETLSRALIDGRRAIRFCDSCGNYALSESCVICRDEERERSQLCVVRDPRDVAAMERMHDYHGLYHVLHGVLSPMDGVGPSDIRIRELMLRLQDDTVQEVIIATNPDIEGEATAAYLARLIKPLHIKVTRIAHGVPVGSDLEYADEVTLAKAMEGRREL
ncbi:MAG: recombination mediator RecR [Christensenellales bacterium]